MTATVAGNRIASVPEIYSVEIDVRAHPDEVDHLFGVRRVRRIVAHPTAVCRALASYGNCDAFPMQTERIDEVRRVVFHIGVTVEGLGVGDGAGERVRRHETTEARVVIAVESVIQTGFGIALIARKFVVLWTSRAVIQFLAVGVVVR